MLSLRRREFLAAGGALVVGFALATRSPPARSAEPERGTKPGPPDPKQIDTWLAIHADNTATLYIGFVELGQGTTTALPQIAAEELDLKLDQIKTVRTDTNVTPSQGGTYSSSSIARGGPQVRTAAAEARQALLKLAAARLDAPVNALTVAAGVVTAAGTGSRVTYGELVGGKLFEIPFTGSAPVKSPRDYKIVGARAPRKDLGAKVAGGYAYVQHERLPGMLHGRVVRPRGQRAYGVGAKVLAVDESSIASIAGARVLRKGDFLGVVSPNEWDAVRAARELTVTWDDAPSLPAFDKLYAQMRAGETLDTVVLEKGSAGDAFEKAPHRASFAGRCPYQAHATFAPNCALADVKADSALVLCSSQDIYGVRRTLGALLGLAEDKVRVQYCDGSGTYGHSCYDDVALAAALLSQLARAPVRVQFMRHDARAAQDSFDVRPNRRVRVSRLASPLEPRRDDAAARGGHRCRRVAELGLAAGEPAELRRAVRDRAPAARRSSAADREILSRGLAALAARSLDGVRVGASDRRPRGARRHRSVRVPQAQHRR